MNKENFHLLSNKLKNLLNISWSEQDMHIIVGVCALQIILGARPKKR